MGTGGKGWGGLRERAGAPGESRWDGGGGHEGGPGFFASPMRLPRVGSCGHVRLARPLEAPRPRRQNSALLLGASWAVWKRLVVQVVSKGGGELLNQSSHVPQVFCCFSEGEVMMTMPWW